MSLLDKYMKGWRFRTTKPSLEEGSMINIFVNRYKGDNVGVANVGDTRLFIEGVEAEHVEKRVRVKVTDFDHEESVGRAAFRKIIGESSYTG